eukprot:scaffold45597_cov20-Tisochrysis_lutea.AAC.1
MPTLFPGQLRLATQDYYSACWKTVVTCAPKTSSRTCHAHFCTCAWCWLQTEAKSLKLVDRKCKPTVEEAAVPPLIAASFVEHGFMAGSRHSTPRCRAPEPAGCCWVAAQCWCISC